MFVSPRHLGEHCEFYIFQATPHCLLGSDGYIRDCPQDFIGVQTAFGTLKRITTYYQSGSIKEESTYLPPPMQALDVTINDVCV